LFEEIVSVESIDEDVLHDKVLKTRREHVNELVHFFLIVESVLGCEHEFSDFCLDCLWKLHVLHDCVDHIDLFLEFLTSSVDALENGSHGTKNVSIH